MGNIYWCIPGKFPMSRPGVIPDIFGTNHISKDSPVPYDYNDVCLINVGPIWAGQWGLQNGHIREH